MSRAGIVARCGPGVYWTRDKIVAAAVAWGEQYGAAPKAEQWRCAGEDFPNVCTVQARFGSWAQMLTAAGFEPRKNGSPRYWTRENIVAAILRFHAEHGRAPQVREMTADKGGPHFSTVVTFFGSHREALTAAGLECPIPGRRIAWTEDLIAQALLDEVFRTGRWPTGREWMERRGDESRPSYRTVLNRFGTWNAAKRYAGWIPPREQRERDARQRAKQDRNNLYRRSRRALENSSHPSRRSSIDAKTPRHENGRPQQPSGGGSLFHPAAPATPSSPSRGRTPSTERQAA